MLRLTQVPRGNSFISFLPAIRFQIEIVFFPPEKLEPKTIKIDPASIGCDSPEIQKRLTRIEENYGQLDVILGELENQFQTDERLKAIDDSNTDFELTFGIKRKRKWRPAKVKPKSKSRRQPRASADPKKPR